MLDLPSCPPSEFEWEDLLVRLELMPRALAVVLEGADLRTATISCLLEDLVERERWAGRLIEIAATGIAGAGSDPPAGGRRAGSPLETFDEFVRRRRRTFAMVQRRGVDVWEWTLGEGAADLRPATAYQLLTFLAASDVEVLVGLRAASEGLRC